MHLGVSMYRRRALLIVQHIDPGRVLERDYVEYSVNPQSVRFNSEHSEFSFMHVRGSMQCSRLLPRVLLFGRVLERDYVEHPGHA